MQLESIEKCPLCGTKKLSPFLICQDYTASQEKFNLIKCINCSFVITSPRPVSASLGKYYESDTYISHTGGASSIFDSIYLFVRRFTLKRKTNLIRKFNPVGTILDYGCGTGDFIKAAATAGWQAYGIEPSDIAHSKASLASHVEVYKSLDELPKLEFDTITLWHVLEHVEDLSEKINSFKNLLKANGTLFVAVPNHSSWDAQVYQEHWAGYDVPRHLWHFTKETMEVLAKNNGFTINKILPMKLDAYYVSLLSEKYKRGAQSITGTITACINALLSNIKAKKKNNYSSLIYILKK